MTKEDLAGLLQAEGVPARFYSLEGGLYDDRFCLAKTHFGWEVYYSERGKKWNVRSFSSEHEACEYMYKEIKELMQFESPEP